MSRVIVGRWGKSLAVRVPLDIAHAAGLGEGEAVEVEAVDGDIHIRRSAAKEMARRDALAAVAEIVAASAGKRLDGLTIRELREEGRRG
jgi:antitoxin component of MazEF toxin-antitoxin module